MKMLLVLLLASVIASTVAQDFPRREIDLQQIADNLYGSPDQELSYEEIHENLMQLLSQPLDVNQASAEEFRALKLLSEAQVNSLIEYRRLTGNLLSVYELQAVPGFDLNTIHNIIPFVTVRDPLATIDRSLLRRILSEGENYFLLRLERTLQTKKGFKPEAGDGGFTGPPGKLYTRFRSSRPGDFSFGFTMEKDDGEQIIWKPASGQYGFDFLSFHAQVQRKGRLRNLVLGDFQSQFGQGLVLGGGFGMGKGGETITTVRRSSIGVSPYTSLFEAGFLRGAAATVEVRHDLTVTGFFSRTNRDANIETEDEDPFVSSLQTTGLHRSQKELASRHAIGEKVWGAALQYVKGSLEAGLLHAHVSYDHAVRRKPTPYNQFAFGGSDNRNTSIYLNGTFRNVTLFSEVARSWHGGWGTVVGALATLSPKLDFSLLLRQYDRDFYTISGNAFSENTMPQNESGAYWGWKYRFNRRWITSGYVDIFSFPWLKFRSYRPSTGHEWLLRAEYLPSRKVRMFIQVRQEQKERNANNSDQKQYYPSTTQKHNITISSDYGINQKIRLKSRIQCSTFSFQRKRSSGMAMIQGINLEWNKFQLAGHLALFDTEDYDNRQYAYENDVWLAYSLPAYDGKGIRKCIVAGYKLNKLFTFWIRYAHTRYTSRDEIGSGMETIDGNIRNDIKFQARLKF